LKPVRELMKDPKVAGGLAVLALLFVVYRMTHMPKRGAAPARVDNGAAAAARADNVAPVSSPNGALAAVAPDNAASAAALPKGDVAWNWERNPFIGPPRKGAGTPGGGEVFPTIIVPGFGPKPAPPAAPPPSPPADQPAARPPAKAEEALPELRGTVISGESGIAVFGSKLVPVGEQVAGWTLERVTAYDVTVSKGGDRRTIGLSRLGSPKGKGGKP
jgi:hypothetical protein